jgi:hypothetical protein
MGIMVGDAISGIPNAEAISYECARPSWHQQAGQSSLNKG